MKTNKEFRKWLRTHDACAEGMREVAGQTPEQFFKTTDRGEWLLWWIRYAVSDKLPGYPTKQALQKAAVEFARMALPFTKNECLKFILDEVEKFLNGNKEINITELRKEANKIADAAAAAAAYAAAAVYAADARKEYRKKIADYVREKLAISFN